MNAAGAPRNGASFFLRPVDILAAARNEVTISYLARGRLHGSKRRYFIFWYSFDFLRFLMCTFVVEYIKKSIFAIDCQARN